MRKDAVIDKLVGDEVMGLFIPLFIGEDAVRNMVEAGIEFAPQGEEIPFASSRSMQQQQRSARITGKEFVKEIRLYPH